MILLRKNAFSETSIEIPFKEDEIVQDLVIRTVTSNGYDPSEAILNHFQVLINGLKVDKDLWPIVVVKESDQVLIAPIIARGEGAQLFKTFAIIAITIAASVFLSPAAGAGVGAYLGSAVAVAAISVGSTLLLNSLIPPPGLPGLGGLGGLDSAESQMYSITSQSNTVKKFGAVPKVYGTHRIFPLVAANPYTEIEPDPETSALVQYFYGIYDFGFSPCEVTDIKLGNTPIEEFSNHEYKLVDFNKPEVDEGIWDERLQDKLSYYRGDLEREDVTYSIDKNSSATTASEDDFRVIRNTVPVTDDSSQEIILDFVCPQGLISYGTDGKTYNRSIDLLIEFRRLDEPDNWVAFNDITHVSNYDTTGGEENVYRDGVITIAPITNKNYYDLLRTINNQREYSFSGTGGKTYDEYKYGFRKGRTYFDALAGSLPVGRAIFYQGDNLGTVASIIASPIPGYSRYILNKPFAKSYELFSYKQYKYSGSYSRKVGDSSKILYSKFLSLGEVIVTDKISSQKYFTVKFKPLQPADFAVRVTRVRSYSAATYQVQDKLTLLSISTRFDRAPILTDKRHIFLDLKIRATNQLNGSVSNLSAVVTSILDVYDPLTQTWSKQITDNPAWVFCDLLTGDVNPKPMPKSKLHMESILEWAAYCDEIPESNPLKEFTAKRFTCNFVLDFDTTLQSLLNSVCNGAQASLNIIDGKYGVLIDKLKTTPIQIFTPRNSWDFSSTRNYFTPPHALKIKFVSPSKDWEVDEAIVYDTGYDAQTATDFQDLSSFACTEYEQAWRLGRYMMAQARLRQETISINVDFEHIVCTRGDYVQITQDVMKVGGRPARVKSITGNRIKIDDGIDTTAVPYGYVFRGVDGIETSTLTVVDSDEFDLNGTLPSVGDLIVIGPVGNVVFDCIVKSISPNNDLSANLTLVEKADGIFDAESSEVIPEYNPQITYAEDGNLSAPPAVENFEVTANTWRVKGGEYEYYIDIDWDIASGVAYETFEIYVDSGKGYNLVDYTKESFYEYIVNTANLGVEHYFKAIGVSATGKKIPIIEAPFVMAIPERKIAPPSDISALYINITNQVIQLEWPRVSDTDLKEYLLRYSPRTEGATWESSIPFARISGVTNTASVQGRTGTYFVKAVDLNSNQSLNSAEAITSIPELFDLNILTETNDFPALPGDKVAVKYDGAGLTLKTLNESDPTSNQYYPEGYYYYSNFLDLGEIYTARLQSRVEAEGFTLSDLMSNWPILSNVEALSNAGTASWDVETYYRGTDKFNTISEWMTLSSIDPLSEGAQDNWSPWKKFIIGDFTARIFQFRLKLISNVANVTPRVFNGVIRADMPDRLESYNDLLSSNISPVSINYSPAFKGPGISPNIQISQDNAQSGDYYSISNKSLNGFDIIFYDVNNNPVVRQFDVAVKGYGRKALAVI